MVAGVAMPLAAQAQTDAEAVVTVDIPAGSLAEALKVYSAQTGVQLVYSSALVDGMQSSGASGKMSAKEALFRILSGTGLTAQMNGGSATIMKADASADGGERVLGAVRVQGSQGGGSSLAGSTPVNGINGSRDVTATEGTGSYTSNALTVGSKTAQSIKDVPMSVSVLTDQQIKDQNITNLTDAMQNMSGVTVANATIPGQEQYYSRGYQITQVQIDGGAPQIISASGNVGITTYRPIIDMSLYDHVELVRGATGTFNGYGDPSGVINLVRKKPLDHPQLLLDFELGSWGRHRVSADVSEPLAFGGKLRGRFIATHQDNNYFFKYVHSNLNILSGTVEYDLTPTTLVSAGANYQTQRQDGGRTGIPRYLDGALLNVSRSTNWTFPWVFGTQENVEFYGQIDQRIGDKWTLRFKGTRIRQKAVSYDAQVSASYIPPSDIDHSVFAQYRGASSPRTKQTQFEVTVDGSFRLFGQTQKIVLGANYSMVDQGGSATYNGEQTTVNGEVVGIFGKYYFDPFNFEPNILAEPSNYMNVKSKNSYIEKNDIRNINAYVNFEITPFSRLHIVSGIHYSAYRSRSYDYNLCTQRLVDIGFCAALGLQPDPHNGVLYKGSQFSWPPSVVAKFDFSSDLAVYGGYTDIYQDQSYLRTKDGSPLPPLTGGNFEGGLKWLSPSKKLNIAFSGYYIRKKNSAIAVCDYDSSTDLPQCTGSGSGPASGGALVAQSNCCFTTDPNWREISYGVDLEVSGEVRKGWQISASYNWGRTLAAPTAVYPDGKRQPLQSFLPPQQFRLWSTYAFDDGSALKGLVLGLGARGQTKTFVQTYYCPMESVTPTGCAVSVWDHPVYFIDPGHVVLNASIGYRISDKLSLNVEIENLLDRTYLATIGGLSVSNFYGTPRSAILTLRGKF
ncbi:TonB-dependent receptor [Sphingomonas sp.]|uniref:TonB-dependent siderophore receptor n=1 Tax=Sphingomonas sp. TaxID=28214 RepID=UPI0025D0E99F|nr:TonB-dependent receptor [Sphingomonas sp.]